MESIFGKLCNPVKLERDKGVSELQQYIAASETAGKSLSNLKKLELKTVELLSSGSDGSWETKHGCLMAVKAILEARGFSHEFAVTVNEKCFRLLDDSEFRVRQTAGEVMGILCKVVGPDIYAKAKDIILSAIQTNLEREPRNCAENSEEKTEKLPEKIPMDLQQKASNVPQIFHDTAGWKSLETWMKCLQCVIEGCGHLFNPHINQELLNLIIDTLTHTNRFVRETGYYVCASLVGCGVNTTGAKSFVLEEGNAIFDHGHLFTLYLAKGLADNWSQVRLASSVATRKFLHSLPTEAREQFFPILLPRMCLNRYYVAEGVRIFSQETWRQVTVGEGKLLVEKYISKVVEYYIKQTDADNHAVREAACTCIAELGSKIDKVVVRPFVPQLLEALLVCFNDDSWPVRDAACVACGNFVLCFPEESKGIMSALYPLFFNNLQDNIPSVRQGAAGALSNVARAYGFDAYDIILNKIKEGLTCLENQPATSEKYSNLDKGPATYGVSKQQRDNDMELHTDRMMYSCGSLAPKMGSGRGGGCMDHKFRKPPEPWELADGCVTLVADLSFLPDLTTSISQLLPLVAKAASYQHYTQYLVFLETICKQLPNIARGIGKRHFKSHIELFLDAIFSSLSSGNALTSSAASQCLNQLSSILGPNILRGRVEQHNPKYLDMLDANQYIAAL